VIGLLAICSRIARNPPISKPLIRAFRVIREPASSEIKDHNKTVSRSIVAMTEPVQWQNIKEYEEILFQFYDGIAKITINRPEVRNAFRPLTVNELLQAFDIAHEDPDVGAIILTGEGDQAFCSGGDQKVRGHAGYVGSELLENGSRAAHCWVVKH
jgi:hypothetical protein